MMKQSMLGLLVAGLCGSGSFPALPFAAERRQTRQEKRMDAERMATAEEKRARKNLKRLVEAQL